VSDCESTAVNEDGVDCDASTSGSVVKFNYCHDLVRYGVFFEQSASHNVALGNICNNDGRDINIYNNSATPRGDTAFNSALCNWCLGSNGIRNGSTGTNVVQSSHNFLFNNTIVSADIESQTNGTQNYYSQNYLAGGALSTAGVEAFFNSTDVSSNSCLQSAASGLAVLVLGASTSSKAAVVIGQPSGLKNDQWAMIPTDSGYYQVKNLNSGLDMNVNGAALTNGALIIQYPFGSNKNDQWMPMAAGNGLYYFINRLSGLSLTASGTVAGVQLTQQSYTGGPGQQFGLPPRIRALLPPSFASAKVSGPGLILAGQGGIAGQNYSVLVSSNLASPRSQWPRVATNVFDANGNFIFTNTPNTAASQEFYLISPQ
jgi:hypothetical protein